MLFHIAHRFGRLQLQDIHLLPEAVHDLKVSAWLVRRFGKKRALTLYQDQSSHAIPTVQSVPDKDLEVLSFQTIGHGDVYGQLGLDRVA